MATEKHGVVIFSTDYCSNQGLAAAHWASSVFPKLSMERNSVRFLLVEERDKTTRFEDKITEGDDKGEFKRLEQLAGMVQTEAGREFTETFDDYIKNKFRQDVVVFTTCSGIIQEILEKAIKIYSLDTLVIGMAALGSPCKNVDLLGLTAKCRVVLVNIEGSDQPPKTTAFNITPVPEVGTSSKAPKKNAAQG